METNQTWIHPYEDEGGEKTVRGSRRPETGEELHLLAGKIEPSCCGTV